MITFGAKTDTGKERKMNQDFYLAEKTLPPLFVLCDGMGGHLAGDVASRTAAESAQTFVRMQPLMDITEAKAKKILKNAVSYANKIVYNRSLVSDDFKGMGTTMDICLVDIDMLYIAHVGDSRVYLLREGKLQKLTNDHSYVEEMLQSGLISPEEAENHPNKNVITRAVGTNFSVEHDFISLPLLDDDMILMCSDGVSNMLSDAEIQILLESGNSPDAIAERIVSRANENGGMDNITAIVFQKKRKEEN